MLNWTENSEHHRAHRSPIFIICLSICSHNQWQNIPNAKVIQIENINVEFLYYKRPFFLGAVR